MGKVCRRKWKRATCQQLIKGEMWWWCSRWIEVLTLFPFLIPVPLSGFHECMHVGLGCRGFRVSKFHPPSSGTPELSPSFLVSDTMTGLKRKGERVANNGWSWKREKWIMKWILDSVISLSLCYESSRFIIFPFIDFILHTLTVTPFILIIVNSSFSSLSHRMCSINKQNSRFWRDSFRKGCVFV